jgi:hypothetical protein
MNVKDMVLYLGSFRRTTPPDRDFIKGEQYYLYSWRRLDNYRRSNARAPACSRPLGPQRPSQGMQGGLTHPSRGQPLEPLLSGQAPVPAARSRATCLLPILDPCYFLGLGRYLWALGALSQGIKSALLPGSFDLLIFLPTSASASFTSIEAITNIPSIPTYV